MAPARSLEKDMDMRKRHVGTIAGTLAVLVALSGGAAFAKTKTHKVPVKYQSHEVGDENCVKSISIKKYHLEINAVRHRKRKAAMDDTLVEWELKPQGPVPATTTWRIESVGSSYNSVKACKDTSFDANGVAKCTIEKANDIPGWWAYKVVAEATPGCAEVEYDPQIIFRGAGFFGLSFLTIAVAGAIFALLGAGFYYLGRRADS